MILKKKIMIKYVRIILLEWNKSDWWLTMTCWFVFFAKYHIAIEVVEKYARWWPFKPSIPIYRFSNTTKYPCPSGVFIVQMGQTDLLCFYATLCVYIGIFRSLVVLAKSKRRQSSARNHNALWAELLIVTPTCLLVTSLRYMSQRTCPTLCVNTQSLEMFIMAQGK